MILIAFNQEDYIDEAIDGALAQDYPNLEIILSDDCSTDTTFERMQVRADDYRGLHKLRLNRNEKNLGIIGHVNRVAEMATGELIVAAAGDDISYPHRVTATVNLWDSYGGKADLLYFDYKPIGCAACDYEVNRKDEAISAQIKNGGSKVFGSTSAWTNRLFRIFGPMPVYGYWEDKVLSFRAALLGGIGFCDDKVVNYRMERDYRLAGKSLLKQREGMVNKRKGFYCSFLNDLWTLRVSIPERAAECLCYEKKIKKQLGRINKELNLYAKSNPRRVLGLCYLLSGLTWTRWPLRKKLSMAKLVALDMAGRLA
jgi:glycosyltransferase involved in cell wall biosynthesis